MPEDWADEDERDAYEGRAGRAVSRLKATLGDNWPAAQKPADLDELREVREEIMDRLVRVRAAPSQAGHGIARNLVTSSQGEAGPGQTAEKEGSSGAAALSVSGSTAGRGISRRGRTPVGRRGSDHVQRGQ